MAPLTLERKDGDWLDGHAHEWVEAGLISEGQAVAIREYEHLGEPNAPQRLTIVTEGAAYVGSVLALMGGAAVVGPNWDEFGVLGRLGVAIAVMVVGFAAGTWLVRLAEPATVRLGSFLWAVATGGVAMAAAVVMDEVDPRDEGWIPLAIGLPVLLVGLALWRNRDRPLQLLSVAVGAGITLAGIGELTDVEPWYGGILLLAVGAAFAVAAALRFLQPRLLALVVGALGAFIGGFMLGDLNEHLGPAVALLAAVSVVLFALRDRLVPLLVIGVIGSLIATQALLATTFTGPIASMIVSLIGLAIVVAVILRARTT
jgi:hypothetical protein